MNYTLVSTANMLEAIWKSGTKQKLEARKIGAGYSVGIYYGKTKADGTTKWELDREYYVHNRHEVIKDIKRVEYWRGEQ